MTKKCPGCGSTLQSTDPLAVGYIPREKKETGTCVRCFKIKNYNQVDTSAKPRNNDSIINLVNKSKDPVIFLLDLLNINEESIKIYNEIKNEKVLIISKSDIIPKSIKKNTIINWIKNIYKINEDIKFLSTKKNINTSVIEKYFPKSKRTYLLGFTNVGKSTLVNKYINEHVSTRPQLTTSMIPNTTLDFNEIKINDFTLIDSPGFTYEKTFYNINEIDLIKRIDSKKFISPITYQTKEIMHIILEDKIIINSDIDNSLTFYMSNFLELKKIYNIDKYNNLKTSKLKLKDNTDIVIKGIGFINVKKACNINIKSNLLELIEVRESMFYE